MKRIILILLFMPILAKAQETTNVTNLQLKGGTVKVISGLIATNADTSIGNMFHKWREDYIDGSVPNDNANVTISTTKTANVIYIYDLLLNLPGGYLDTDSYLTDFRTSILSKRATNSILDAGCTALEANMSARIASIKSGGLGYLQLK